MSTRTVVFDYRQPDLSGTDAAAGGYVKVQPFPQVERSKPGYRLIPEQLMGRLVEGVAEIPLECTDTYTTGCWLVESPLGVTRFITVPAGDGAITADQCPDVDPATFAVVNPAPSVGETLVSLQAQIDGLGGPAADASTTAKGIVELATNTETTTGTDTARATTPAGVAAAIAAAIANLIAAAPGALDTLNELAAALGDDANFSTTVATALAARVRTDTAAQGLDSTQQANARTNIGAAAAADLASYQPAGSYVTSAEVASYAVWCYWDGDSWQTLAGSAVPTSTSLVRIYDSTQYDTAGVTAPTHYNALDKWWQKAA